MRTTLQRFSLAGVLLACPLLSFAEDPVSGEPDVTIVQKGDKTVEEYRVNGFLYAVKVTPKKANLTF